MWILVLAIAGATTGCGDDGGDHHDHPDAAAVPSDPDAAIPDDPDAAVPELDIPDGHSGFGRRIIDSDAHGPAFAAVADVDGDGALDIVTSQFGAVGMAIPRGRVAIYTQGATLDDWTRDYVFTEEADIVFPNQIGLEDIDGDEDLDVVVPYGFLICNLFQMPCGGLAWFEQTDTDWIRHDIVATGNDYFYHRGLLIDIDGDDIDDLITVAETFSPEGGGAETQWFKGTNTSDRFETTPHVIGAGLGGLPEAYDLDGDDDLDLVSSQFFAEGASFAWMEQIEAPSKANPAGVWVHHVIDDTVGGAIQARVIPDLFGDGAVWIVGSNHVNVHEETIESAVYAYSVPDDPRDDEFSRIVLSDGIEAAMNEGFARNAAPGIFGYGDIDGDEDIDLIVSGDGDPDVYWLEQTDDGFDTIVLQPGLPQAGASIIEDLDGDGWNEVLVSGYEHDALLLFQLQVSE
jgi:hypothetical protein